MKHITTHTSNFSLQLIAVIFLAIIIITAQPVSAKLMAAASSNSVILNWTAPGDDGGNGQASQYDIRYATAPIDEANFYNALAASGIPQPQVAGSAESFEVINLVPNTTYYFAIKVADEVPNWSAVSNVVIKTTDPETTPPSQIITLAVTDAGGDFITLSWTAVGDDGDTGTASMYDIRYSTDSLTLAGWDMASQANNEPLPQIAGSSETITILNLTQGTKYYFAIRTADEIPNWSVSSNIVNGTTSNEQIAPAAVADLLADLPTDGSIRLIWTAPGDDGNSGQAATYDIRYSTSIINNNPSWDASTLVTGLPSPKTAGIPETLIVNNLNQEMTYYFALKTADEVANWSAMSNVANATTLDETPPAAINDLQASTGTESGSIILGWTAPGDDNYSGVASLYEIRYSEVDFDESDWMTTTLYAPPPIPAPGGADESIVLTGLNPGQQYYIGIKAYDNQGNVSLISNLDSAEAYINISTDIGDGNGEGLPDVFTLSQNYPNPFNPSTGISFNLPKRSRVELNVYNIYGQKVATLANDEFEAGEHLVEWNGRADNGQLASTGMYVYRIVADEFTASKKMVFLK